MEVDGQVQAGAGREELDPPVLRALLPIPLSQPFLLLFQGCVWDTEWGQRDTGEVRQWLMAW